MLVVTHMGIIEVLLSNFPEVTGIDHPILVLVTKIEYLSDLIHLLRAVCDVHSLSRRYVGA